MSDETRRARLIILVTRVQGEADEWEEVWGFGRRPGQEGGGGEAPIAALIRLGEPVSFAGAAELERGGLRERLRADVWVFHGVRLGEVYSLLDSVAWKDVRRGVLLKIHLGQGGSVADAEFKEVVEEIEYENTKWLLRRADEYSLGVPADPDHPVTVFAGIVRDQDWEHYPRALELLGGVPEGAPGEEQQALPYRVRISLVKHNFQNVLQPLNIDLQGLIEVNFREDYWEELWGSYEKRERGPGKVLERAREFLYGRGRAWDTVEQIIADAGGAQELAGHWERIQQLFPKEGAPPDEVADVFGRMTKGNRELLKAHFKGGVNPVRAWIANLERELGGLREALAETEKVGSDAGG